MAYSKMKTEAIREIKEVIAKTTAESMKYIGLTVTTVHALAVRYMNYEYEAILKELIEFDTIKEEMERQTKEVI